MIRPMKHTDAADVLRIFTLGIESGKATFDAVAPT
jgi:L-amino acid N-acyltransferase YncA